MPKGLTKQVPFRLDAETFGNILDQVKKIAHHNLNCDWELFDEVVTDAGERITVDEDGGWAITVWKTVGRSRDYYEMTYSIDQLFND